jgi:hypothetical protein
MLSSILLAILPGLVAGLSIRGIPVNFTDPGKAVGRRILLDGAPILAQGDTGGLPVLAVVGPGTYILGEGPDWRGRSGGGSGIPGELTFASLLPEYKYDPDHASEVELYVRVSKEPWSPPRGCSSFPAGPLRFRILCQHPPLPGLAGDGSVLWVSRVPELTSTPPAAPAASVNYGDPKAAKALILPETTLLRGKGKFVVFSDTAIDLNHCAYYSPGRPTPFGSFTGTGKVIGIIGNNAAAYFVPYQSHGTLTAGAGAGQFCSGQFGMADLAAIGLIDLTIHGGLALQDNFFDLLGQAADAGADVHSASWKIVGNEGAYSDLDHQFDLIAYQRASMLHVVAAGNDGPWGQVASPANGKNVLSVGASSFKPTVQAHFSSTGYSDDGRRKPDVLAPSWNVVAPEADTSQGLNHVDYVYASGDSLGAPLVAGAALILSEMRNTISSSLRIATFIAHTTRPEVVALHPDGSAAIDGVSLTTFGFPQIGESRMVDVFDAEPMWDQGVISRCYLVKGTGGLVSVGMAWMDIPAMPGANPTIVDNVDLVLLSDTGAVIQASTKDNREYGELEAFSMLRIMAWLPNPPTDGGPVRVSIHARKPQGTTLVPTNCLGDCLPSDPGCLALGNSSAEIVYIMCGGEGENLFYIAPYACPSQYVPGPAPEAAWAVDRSPHPAAIIVLILSIFL